MIKVKKNKGFTLVELLVVIAIIAIIAVIAIPNLYKAINKAKAKKLVVEMNVISNAITEYYLEHGTLDLEIMDNNQSESITDHMYLKDHMPLQACFDSEISTSPFGGWYYIEDEDDKIYVTITIIPPKGAFNGFKDYGEKVNEAMAGMETIKSMKKQIEKDSSNKIEVIENDVIMTIDKQ